MYQYFEQSKLSKHWYLSIPVIFLGIVGGTTSILPGKLAIFSLMVTAAIAIVIQYEKPALAKLYAPVKEKTWRWVIPIVIITIVVTFATIFLGQALGIQSVANGALDGPGTVGQKLFQLVLVCVSLIGEEMITAVMTLPFFSLLLSRMDEDKAWWIAEVIGSVLFGLMHVNVYHFNMYQCIVATGLTRLPFTWLWKKSDSLTTAIVAHILYDVILFLPEIFS